MGKGGGGGSAPKAHSVPQLATIMGSTQTLGGFSAQLLQPLLSMYNWASDIATGGNVNPAVASFPYSSVLGAPPNAQGYNAFTGLNTPGGSIFGGTALGPGSNKVPYYQSAVFGMPGQDYFYGPGAMPVRGASTVSSGGGGAPATMTAAPGGFMDQSGFPAQGQLISWSDNKAGPKTNVIMGTPVNSNGQMMTPLYDFSTEQFVGWRTPSGDNVQGNPQGLVPATYSPWSGGQQPGSNQPAGLPTGQGPTSLLGPFLSQAWASIGDEFNAAQMIPGIMQQTAALTNEAQTEGKNLMTEATTGTGLFPSQQALVDQGVQSQKAALAQQLASEGLGSSTQLAMLQGEADQAGAATAGQLIQGNIALAQASQKIALGGQELSLGEQSALTTELASIAGQSAGLQQNMWTEAMQGMGMVGQMVGTALSAFGYETNAASVQANLNIANAQIAAQAQQASQQSSGSGFSSLLGGLGSILGGSGGLGGLFGGIGATVGGAAAGVGGASGGISAAVSAIGLAAVA